MPGLNYIYQFRKISAQIENTAIEARLHKITSACQSPMDIDPRKGAVIYFRSDHFPVDHPELTLKPGDFATMQQWIDALKKSGSGALPVSILGRIQHDTEQVRYVVSGSVPSYQSETLTHVGVWFPTKAYRAEQLCDRGNSNPETAQEKLDFRIRRVNHFLYRYSAWVNGENYSLTLKLTDKEKGIEEIVVKNMFLGSGYEYCSEIARSYISLTMRQHQGLSVFNPKTTDDDP
jgi:hypothetical protein